VCLACPMAYDDLDPDAAGPAIRAVLDRLEALAGSACEFSLRARPPLGGWSALEYACHLRDVFAVYTLRLYRARGEDVPLLEPMLNDVRAIRFNYNGRDLPAVFTEMRDNAAGLATELASTVGRDWLRLVRRGYTETRTAAWLARQAVHESQHHLRDIARCLSLPDGPR
jgi:hypothetical protein